MATKAKHKGRTFPVHFGNANFGDKKVGLPVKISRGNITVAQADELLCGKRITVTILARPEGSGPEQNGLPGLDGDIEVVGVADVGSFSGAPKNISATLSFLIASLKDQAQQLTYFAKRDGQLVISNVEEGDGEDTTETNG